ncbi:MAG: restriction endonuclease subunit S [Polyangia bacterium]
MYPTRQLGDVAEFLDNMRRPVTESDRRVGPFPYYGANGPQGMIDEFIFDEPLVLLAEDGGHFDEPERGIAYRISGKTWVNNHAHVLRAKPGIDLAFLCRVLENYDVRPFVTGTTRGKLTKAGASEILVPVPPLPEQRRIAEVLDRAEALRAKRRAALAQLDTLTQSIFLDLFGDPATNPKKWARSALGNVIAEGPQNGIYKPASDYGTGTRILRIDAFYDGAVTDLATLKRVRISESERQLYGLCSGDVVVNRVNSMEYLGKSALIPDLDEPTIFESNMMRFSVDRDQVDPKYVVEFLQTQFVKRQILTSAKNAVNQSSINQQDVTGFLINVPPVSLQRTFVGQVAAVDKLKSAHRASLAKLDALFASLQHRAFRGEL